MYTERGRDRYTDTRHREAEIEKIDEVDGERDREGRH